MVQAVEITMGHRDLPQALVLLGEMNGSVQHVVQLVDNMIQKVRKGELSTNEGLSFLEMKYNMLLSYLINLTYVVLRKCSGKRIEDDPCIDRLIEIRTVLEKIRPIDHKLKYQIDKLVKTAATGVVGANDPANFKANPDNLLDKPEEFEDSDSSDESDGKEKAERPKSGVYVPPKLSAVHYSETDSNKNRSRQEASKKLSLSSSILQDLREEYLDTPIEISQANLAQQKLSKQQIERTNYEEEYMTRLPSAKSDSHKRRQMNTVGALGDEITDFQSTSGPTKRKRKHFTKSKGKTFKRKRFH